MSFFNLAAKNIKSNFKNYIAYFVSTSFAVMIFYIFYSLYYNKQFVEMSKEMQKLQVAFKASAVVIAVFSIMFIWYCSSFFIKNRKKEIATYSLLGMTKKHIARMLFCENIIMGIGALLTGITFGTMFSKLFSMLLIYIIGETAEVRFVIETRAIMETALIFFILFLINALLSYSIIYRFKLIELFSAEKEGERAPKPSKRKAILGILLIAAGYAIAVLSGVMIVLTAIPVLVVTIAGTYIIFDSLVISIVRFIRERKSYYYRGVNLIGISQLLYRIKGNARTLATIAVLGAVTITAVGTTFCFYMSCERLAKEGYPYTLVYVEKGNDTVEKVEGIINKHGEVKVVSSDTMTLIQAEIKLNDGKTNKTRQGYIMSDREYNTSATHRGVEGIGKLKNDEQCRTGIYSSARGQNIEIKVENSIVDLRIEDRLSNMPVNGAIASNVVVVPDRVYDQLYRESSKEKLKVIGYMLDKPKKTKALAAELNKELPKEANLISFYDSYGDLLRLVGVMAYIGAFLGLLFMLATGSIIYFKQLMEASEDKRRYRILRNIGVSAGEIRIAVAKQMGIVFGLPLIISICHSAVALSILKQILRMDIFIYCAMVTGIYVLIYGIYYFMTVSAYVKQVSQSQS